MIKAGFILLTVAMLFLIFRAMNIIARKVADNNNDAKRMTSKIVLLLLGWCTYIYLVSATGILSSMSLPPRIPLFLILPCFAFITYFLRSKKFQPIVSATPLTWLTYTQGFRVVVELFLLGLYLQGLLPKAATFEGYNYEIIIGITAIPMGIIATKSSAAWKNVLKAWNICGLITLAIVVFIIMKNTYQLSSINNAALEPKTLIGTFPYTILPGFLMPLAVFTHLFSLVKIRKSEKH